MFDVAKVIFFNLWANIWKKCIYIFKCQTVFHLSGYQVQYKKEYEKNKAQSDYNTLPATDNPLLRQLRYAGTILSDVGISTERSDW